MPSGPLLLSLGAGGRTPLRSHLSANKCRLFTPRFKARPIGLDEAVRIKLEESGISAQKPFDTRGSGQDFEIVLFKGL